MGERLGGAYVALLGPTDLDHQWQCTLHPGDHFTTVPVSVAVSGPTLAGAASGPGLTGAAAALTAHRRALVRPHRAAAAGAEVFCIDAGWYNDGTTWWDSVGEWQPSQTRFPRGIEEVLARIRDHRMVPGLWLEPEVVGVRSPLADKLPPAAYLQRGGVRLVEHDRYHLDLRHPRALAHLDEVVDRLVEQLGVGYLKLDYNIDPGAGTDRAAESAGAGLLAHNRAYLSWLDGVLDRYPDLILENCASGAMRMDYALLSRMQLQSTSDQQDFRRYPPIAVAAPLSVLPEQSASWAYPQPEMSAEEIGFVMCTGLLGRLYLSGHLDRLSPAQRESVHAAVALYRGLRAELATAAPLWPLGLPGWTDPWLSLALATREATYLAVWWRGPAEPTAEPAAAEPPEASLDLPHLRGQPVTIDVLYPRQLPAWSCHWDPDLGRLDLATHTPPAAVSARIFRIAGRAAASAGGSTL